jgi:hypothetical protein
MPEQKRNLIGNEEQVTAFGGKPKVLTSMLFKHLIEVRLWMAL